MFANALEKVAPYTHPVIISKRLLSGHIHCGLATFIVLNNEGWILTAGHLFQDHHNYEEHKGQVSEYQQRAGAIQRSPSLKPQEKQRLLRGIPYNADWISNLSYWWGGIGQWSEVRINPLADLAVARLDQFNADAIATYPIFKNPNSPLRPGTSLCRLGFPFHAVSATYDETTGNFQLADGVLPVPRFPSEGIYTREMILRDETSQAIVTMLETSSPGLGGQSGGPVFDSEGRIWGLQSHTAHLDLGFDAKYQRGNHEVIERQFLNVGRGPDVREILKFLNIHNISYRVAEES